MIAIMSSILNEMWSAEARERQLAAGEILFRAGDPVQRFFRVERGTVALVRLLPQGAELVVQRAGPGAVLAEASLFAQTYHCEAVALTETLVRSVPRERVATMMRQRPTVAIDLARYLAAEVQNARARAEIVSLRTTGERLDAWLALNDGTMPPKGHWRDVATEIGVTPEAFYRELGRRRIAGRGLGL